MKDLIRVKNEMGVWEVLHDDYSYVLLEGKKTPAPFVKKLGN
jgi:hypothetical protein